MTFLAKKDVVLLPRKKKCEAKPGKKGCTTAMVEVASVIPAQPSKTMKLYLDWQNSLV